NFLFAIVAYWAVFMVGVPAIKPIIDEVPAQSVAAEAGLSRGDEIVAINDNPTTTWKAVRLTLLEKALNKDRVRITVADADGGRYNTQLDLRHVSVEPDELFKQLGLKPYQPSSTPVIARVVPDSPAAAAGLSDGAKILAVNGKPTTGPRDFVSWIQ